MNPKLQQQAERAALAQRLMLRSLANSLQTQERELSELENRAAKQASAVGDLQREFESIRAVLGVEPSELEHLPQSKPAKWGSRHTPTPAPLQTHPKVPEDWDAFMRQTEEYLEEQGVSTDEAPLLQLLPAGLGAHVCEDYKRNYCAAAWDKMDYGIVGVSVLAAALLDFFLVATPNGTFQGKPQRQSPLTKWFQEQSEYLAPINSRNKKLDRNPFQKWVVNLATDAEKWAKVPYDLVIPKVGLTPNVHRLASLGHDPVLGLVYGVLDILSGRCTFIDRNGAWQVIGNIPGHPPTSNVVEALLKVIVHGLSDVFTKQGIPAPFMGLFQLLGVDSGFVVRKGGDSVSIRDLTRYMYSNGYDLRHFMTMAIVPGAAELIHWVYHAGRAFQETDNPGKAAMPQRLKRQQMLLLTHALLSSTNVLKTALYGWNPMALNFAQFIALATRMLTLVKLSWERARQVQDDLRRGWEKLHTDTLHAL